MKYNYKYLILYEIRGIMTDQKKDLWKKILNSGSFDEVLDIFDVVASYIRERHPQKKDGLPNTNGFHFLERVQVNYLKNIAEEDPHNDYSTAVLVVDAPMKPLKPENKGLKKLKKIGFP